MKSGFIAIVGRPNVGKSTLLNAIIGEKVAIVSPKPQTTRDNIVGILHGQDFQIVFTDTPGVHSPQNSLGDFMMKSVDSATKDVSGIVVVIDSTKGVTDKDIKLLRKYEGQNIPIICVLSKVDMILKEKLLPEIARLSELGFITTIVPLSSKKKINLDVFIEETKKLLKDDFAYYPEEMITDKSEKYMVTEIIRESALYAYNEEIPHGVGVSLNLFEIDEKKDMYRIDADLVCEKNSHKAIIIGKGAEALKRVSTTSRIKLEEYLDKKVFLNLWVRVKEGWRDRQNLLKEFGYDKKELD